MWMRWVPVSSIKGIGWNFPDLQLNHKFVSSVRCPFDLKPHVEVMCSGTLERLERLDQSKPIKNRLCDPQIYIPHLQSKLSFPILDVELQVLLDSNLALACAQSDKCSTRSQTRDKKKLKLVQAATNLLKNDINQREGTGAASKETATSKKSSEFDYSVLCMANAHWVSNFTTSESAIDGVLFEV